MNEPAPGRVSTSPRTCSAPSASRTDARPTPEPLGQLALAGQPQAGAQGAAPQLADEVVGDLLVALPNRAGRLVWSCGPISKPVVA